MALRSTVVAGTEGRSDAGKSSRKVSRRKALFAEVERNDLEGIVAKMQASPYTPQTTWYKIKNPAYSQATGRKEIFEQMRKR